MATCSLEKYHLEITIILFLIHYIFLNDDLVMQFKHILFYSITVHMINALLKHIVVFHHQSLCLIYKIY